MQPLFGKSGFTFDAKDAMKLSLSHGTTPDETITHYRTPSGMYVQRYEEEPGGFTDATPISAFAARRRFRAEDTTRFVSEEEAFPEPFNQEVEEEFPADFEEELRNCLLVLVKREASTPEQADTIWLALMSGTMITVADARPAPEAVKLSAQ